MNSGPSDFFAKTISEPRSVQLDVDGLKLKYERFEQFWDGLTWHLARRASSMGVALGKYRLYKGQGLIDKNNTVTVPSVTVLFLETANEVEIIAIRTSIPESYNGDLDF